MYLQRLGPSGMSFWAERYDTEQRMGQQKDPGGSDFLFVTIRDSTMSAGQSG